MPTAEEFLKHFIKRYTETRNRYNEQEWAEIWGNINAFSNIMIYENDSVIRGIAPLIGLACFPREPLHIDAVFTTTPRWDWFPISVAIEHENHPGGFHGEIKKLCSLRCALKVGITYALLDNAEHIGITDYQNKIMDDVREKIINISNEINNFISEDEGTECLFIIGVEMRPREIEWHDIIFKAHGQMGPWAGEIPPAR